jgi:hypothetical protein
VSSEIHDTTPEDILEILEARKKTVEECVTANRDYLEDEHVAFIF